MNIEEVREFCMAFPNTTESVPFGPNTIVFKVTGKIFVLLNIENNFSINLKCNPEEAILLREKYTSVLPGYHMNKNHWNTILLNGLIPENLLKEWIEKSYRLVLKKQPK